MPSSTSDRPLAGVRILAFEQMQALPYATQLLGRLGADVVKIESPRGGDSGRASLPAIKDPQGRSVGATFLRNNLGKRSICIDLKDQRGRELALRLAPYFDVIAENSRPGVLSGLGLGYEDMRRRHPQGIYVSVSGFGNTTPTPYRDWPAYAPIVEAMSGIYEMKRAEGAPPTVAPVGALGDIGAALFATIGILAALRHRETTGRGQYVDVAMFDAMISMTDIVTNFWSMGLRRGELGPLIMHGFRAKDGWFVLQVGREQHFAKLAELIGHPEWTSDPRLATREGWLEHLEDVLRPAIESWAAARTAVEASALLAGHGIAAGPCLADAQVAADPHVLARNMLVPLPRTDGVAQPVLVPGNPVKLADVPEPETQRPPWLGEHTDEVLAQELGLSPGELTELRDAKVIA
ncbi:CoA transferase [Streptomyces spinoverrucosus]|uniref:CaiB/BaiF CoA transferase family protein n=1 Tax=Streptomyces spinoverrucosus TaxID=284043 RepID=UPI0018C36CAF|nr:CoA transferase [Streptomyces spinoverrucosus]MBG0855743.1 CoA transferase [Streptomyces spinoverrucosus]